ncbi:MAG: fumarylacetoacetate hydrolase family protein [Candidatus Thermoplasmatota archaeon]
MMPLYRFENGEKSDLSVGKIVCLARNYRKHAEEMESDVSKDPLVFLKPSSSVIFNNDSIVIPDFTSCVHHEVELGVVIRDRCSKVEKQNALDYVLGYSVSIDVTARDIQSIAKENGWPWSIPKGIDTFSPISNLVLKENVSDPNDLSLMLKVNGKIRQKSSTSFMVNKVERIIEFVSGFMTLYPGDLIMTGTPEGVSEIKDGDVVEAFLDKHCYLKVNVSKK